MRRLSQLFPLLLAGLMALLFVGSLVVRCQEERLAEGQAELPSAQALRALQQAEADVAQGQLPVARERLERALSQLASQAVDADGLRARVLVARRLARVMALQGETASARRILSGAFQDSRVLADASPGDNPTAELRLSVLLELMDQGGELPLATLLAEARLAEQLLDERALVELWLRIAAISPSEAKGAVARAVALSSEALASEGGHRDALARAVEVMRRGAMALAKADLPQDAAALLDDALTLGEPLKRTPEGARTLAALALERALSLPNSGEQALEQAVAAARLVGGQALIVALDQRAALALCPEAAADCVPDYQRALTSWQEAASAAQAMGASGVQARVAMLGNSAQMLGKLGRLAEALTVAEEAAALAVTLNPKDAVAQEDAALAELRLARLLRLVTRPGQPAPDRAAALATLGRARARIASNPSARAALVAKGIAELDLELKPSLPASR